MGKQVFVYGIGLLAIITRTPGVERISSITRIHTLKVARHALSLKVTPQPADRHPSFLSQIPDCIVATQWTREPLDGKGTLRSVG